jgi:hypothetical protein
VKAKEKWMADEQDKTAERKVRGPKVPEPQPFTVIRHADESGISGTGPVADGIVFPSGRCSVEWRGATPCVQVWPSFDAFKAIHIDAHPDNNTEVKWLLRDEEDEEDEG